MESNTITIISLFIVGILVILLIILRNMFYSIKERHKGMVKAYDKLYGKYCKSMEFNKNLTSEDTALLKFISDNRYLISDLSIKLRATNIQGEGIVYDSTAGDTELTIYNLGNNDTIENIKTFNSILGKNDSLYSIEGVLKDIGFSLVNVENKNSVTNAKRSVKKIYALNANMPSLDINKFNALNEVMPVCNNFSTSPLLVLVDCYVSAADKIDFEENSSFRRAIRPYLIKEEKKHGKVLSVSTSLKLAKIEFENETKIVKIYSL